MELSTCINDLESAAKAKGLHMADACRLAKIHPNTFSRWRQGHTSATIGKLQKLCDAIEKYKP